MNKLFLSKEFFIARGGERDCYHHPSDSSKVIKVIYKNDKNHRNQNNLEYKYLNFLKNLKVPFTQITKCYGYIDTNFGKGLVYDKICDFNGKISIPFLDIVMEEKLSKNIQDMLVSELKNYILENNILFVDIGLYNILCCEYEKEKYKLIIIDGLGGRRPGLKFWLYLNSRMFTKYKVMRSWKRFEKELDRKRSQIKKRSSI
ncbi:YrbL family protein [Aliarcobacter butzleri]|uniref:YrbL family protein n=1 Tax=Aliarcobacter butzleri L352 TaxID=1447260 RepID=A0A837JFJ0_9BACT|nr:YrbL family protein [Aliarcobacter butzleri]KLE07049.1 hypothetical protein AF77_00130 [Aliarcobacter butzleri L352]